MYRMMPLLVLLCFPNSVSAAFAIQTDWSEGGTQPGPVSEWGSAFHISDSINYVAPGSLQLGIVTDLVEHIPGINTTAGMKEALWGDIDLDGDIDLLEVTADDSIFWHEQPSVSKAWTPHFSAAPGDVISIDLVSQGSGTPNWVVDYSSNEYALVDVYSYSSGQYSLGYLGDSSYPSGVTSGDIDGNGTCDVVGWKWAYDEIWVWWSCHPDSMELLFSPHTPSDVFVFDGDGDGDSDMAVHKSWYPETVVYWNDGDWIPMTLPELFYAYGIDAEDIDGDGYCELTAVAYSIQSLFRFSGGWSGETLVDGSELCAFIDLDGDDDIDVAGFGGTGFHLFYNCDQDGNLFYSNYDVGFHGDLLRIADMNQDGREDLILTKTSSGEIRWYEAAARYHSVGSLESGILYLGHDPGWGYLNWNADTPAGTSASFLVRASDDYTDMGAWSDTIFAPSSLSGVLSDNDSYFQYKVILATSIPETTPSLYDVSVSWDPLGIRGQAGGTILFPVHPNPVAGNVPIRFRLEETSNVEIVIFDIAGRRVDCLVEGMMTAGDHAFHLNSPSPGIYFCQMLSGDVSTLQRFAVIE